MQTILVTGGAGYIGSHAVKALCDEGYDVKVIDNLSKGHLSAVDSRAEPNKIDLEDYKAVYRFFQHNKIDAVMHFAGSIEAGLSMKEPADFLRNNVMNSQNLLEAMRRNSVMKIIFSSTAAVYGNPENVPIKENDPTDPTNYYGVTKLMFENILKKYEHFYDLKYVALRYFNAAGADAGGEIGEDHDPETHLIPIVLQHILGLRDKVSVYGTDYDTKDGTCVRDYVHVSDLIDAHILALKYLLDGGASDIFNIGSGSGFTVKEVINAVEKVTGKKVVAEESARRAGDPAVLIADSVKIREKLGWNPKKDDIETILQDAWRWHQNKPNGY
ncbi:UDP-glucose 4-epimerase GalE [Candidatus Peregrinibacteria bacterium]|nr:UDP-glucose 4-epimerase GalE [Candidatus Peregrinibacteria bacterium]